MDAKDLRTEAALGDRSNDGNAKYAQGGTAIPCHRNKSYEDITSNSLAKVDTPQTRPCAVIGPDRVVPPAPTAHTDVYYKKSLQEPWLTPENTYRRPPDYPHKLLDYQHPSRNISPRQTFQENMQRIMVAPSYNAGKLKEDSNYPGESNISQMRNNKLSVPSDSNSKYCDVPYTVNPLPNDHKNVRNSDINVSNMNTVLSRSMPHGWAPTSANMQQSKPLPQELCQYPEYQSCPAPRPVVMARPHRSVHEEPGPVYPESFYQNGNIRFKPYPQVKERYPQTRYEYIGNYSNPFHPPPPFPTHKYDLPKPMPPHPYPSYPQVPFKYLDNRMTDSIMNGYQRSLSQQAAYSSMPFRNQVIHPTYGPVPGSCLPTNKFYPYPPDAAKSLPSNKLPFDSNNKLYPDYEQKNRSKNFPVSDTFYINEIARPLPTKGPVVPPNYPSNIHGMPSHPYYRKEPLKGYEYSSHYRNMDHILGVNSNFMSRFPSQFSPSAINISPSDSNTSNETNLTHAVSQEDCGYVSQSSTASVRSMDSFINKVPLEMYRRYDHNYGHMMKGPAPFTRIDQSANINLHSKKDKKDINVRQFLQMWNEGEEEGSESNNKDVNNKQSPNNANSSGATNQEQLYVLGLVNVPSEELSKYQHIQTVSKLPENIKGYNSIELLHQFEEVIESSNLNHYNEKPLTPKSFQSSFQNTVPIHGLRVPSRPISPLDVEAKISQSIIHKEVGCNFEIKPCSPKMLNVEVATPIQTVIGERLIEKLSNPLISQSPVMQNINESRDDCKVVKSQDRLSAHDNTKNASCKMVSTLYGNKDHVDPVKTNYSIQDLESNSGVCLASLPRLDNDIELNFPEVNQQFINANKVESVITTGPLKDLPPLDTNQTDSINRGQGSNVFHSQMKINPEKDSSKLSKYRKIKRSVSGSSTPETNIQALRTDSVIIKNPENCKNENLENAVSPRRISLETQNDPINLSVNNEHCVKSNIFDFSLNKSVDSKPNDFAIDFSINANECSNFTNHLTLPEITPTDENNLNRAVVVKKDEHKKNMSLTHDIHVKNEDKKILNVNVIDKSYEIKQSDINKPGLPKELSVLTKCIDVQINCPENNLKESQKSKKDTNVALQNSNPEQLQKYIAYDKETLKKKLSSYNSLSSKEKDYTLNEKMRELFGEEFSTAEIETDYEEVHDMQAILDDNVAQEKDTVFSDESSEHAINCKEKERNSSKKLSNLPEDMIIRDLIGTKTKENCSTHENLSKEEVNSENKDYKESNTFSNKTDLVDDKRKTTENLQTPTIIDTKDCTIERKNPERINKELLSPWIQKLILHNEGLSAITGVTKARNHPANDQQYTILNENFETSKTDEHNETLADLESNSALETIDNINNKNVITLGTVGNVETVILLNDEMDLDTKGTKKANLDKKIEILAKGPSKDFEFVTSYQNENNLACHSELKNNIGVLETPEQIAERSSNDTFSVIANNTEHTCNELMESSDELESHSCTNIGCVVLKTDAVEILEIPNENRTIETMKGIDMEKNTDSIELIPSSENIVLNDTAFSLSANGSDTNKSINNSGKSEMNVVVQDLAVFNDTIICEKLTNDTVGISDKTDEILESILESKDNDKICREEKIIESAIKDTNKDVISSKEESCPRVENIETTVYKTEENKLESDTSKIKIGLNLNKSIELKNNAGRISEATNIKHNLIDYDKKGDTNKSELMTSGKNESSQEPESDTDKVSDKNNAELVNYICVNSDMRRDDLGAVLKESDSKMKLKSIILSNPEEVSKNCNLDVKSEKDNKSNKIVDHSINNELDFEEPEVLDISVPQLANNVQLKECSVSSNKTPENIIISKSPEPNVDQPNFTFGKDKELCTDNMSLVMDRSVNGQLNDIIDSSESDKKIMIKIINDNTLVNDCKVNNVLYTADFKNNNDSMIDDSLRIKRDQAECVPFLSSIEKEKQGVLVKTKLTLPSTSLSHDFVASSQDYIPENTEELNHTICDQRAQDIYTRSESLYENQDENCSQFKATENIIQPNSGGIIPNENNFIMSDLSTNQTIPSLEEITSSSDVSDETTSSDDDSSSDTSNSSEFLDSDDNKDSSFSAEHQNIDAEYSISEASGSLPVIDSNNCSEAKNEADFESNNKLTSDKCVEKDIAIIETECECIVEDAYFEDNAINETNNLNEAMFNDPNQIMESEKNETEQVIMSCSEIIKTVDYSGNENNMDNYSLLETPKHEIMNSNYDEVKLFNDCKNVQYPKSKRRKSLKRSLSDSALDGIRDNLSEDSVLWPSKRKKEIEINNFNTSQIIAQNICRVLQSNRRNSISSIHNDGNVSFCILIDNNCIISEECDETQKICFSDIPEDSVTCIQTDLANQDSVEEIASIEQDADCVFSIPVQTNEDDEVLDEPWVEDVACVETVISDDIAENIIISASASPRDEECNDEETEIYNINEHTEKLKYIYGDKMYSDDAHFVDTLYRTPQMNVNKTLSNRESQIVIDDSRYYDKESLERVLSESNGQDKYTDLKAFQCTTPLPSPVLSDLSPNYSENINMHISDASVFESKDYYIDKESHEELEEYPNKEMKENLSRSIEDFTKPEENRKCNISSSPEVSSTTSEEKNAGILLKITNYSGSMASQINNMKPVQSISCKYTEKKEYISSNGNLPTKTLITKAAQKYIPPIKESIRDLKVKLQLPHQSLIKFRQLKMANEAVKPNLDRSPNTLTKNIPKKSKPKFEDVLMSIDELQFQKHKEEKNKNGKKIIPKVVIKKNVLGSHYASTSSKHGFNPDLTGRKWQPWVFLERDHFIDKMALRNKTRAIFSHRKKSYVLAEKFQKYKSICNPKFVISQPKLNESAPGQLKYTIRLKHTY